jgi:hypothetical protein
MQQISDELNLPLNSLYSSKFCLSLGDSLYLCGSISAISLIKFNK